MELIIEEDDDSNDVIDLGFSDYPISQSNKIHYVNPYNTATATNTATNTTTTNNKAINNKAINNKAINNKAINNKAINNTVVSTKKGVTYDDILSNLNMQVVNGKLQISRNISDDTGMGLAQNKQQKQQQQQQQQYQPRNNRAIPTQSVFRDQMQHVPILTPEQNRRIKMAQYIQQVNEYRRIKQVKSTKMFFNNPNISTSHSVPLWMQHK